MLQNIMMKPCFDANPFLNDRFRKDKTAALFSQLES
jgi:hypothetical protein